MSLPVRTIGLILVGLAIALLAAGLLAQALYVGAVPAGYLLAGAGLAIAMVGGAAVGGHLAARAAGPRQAAAAAASQRVEAGLRSEIERLRLAINGSGIGTWHWDLVTGQVERSPTYLELIGRPDLPASGRGLNLEVVHPDDRAAAAESLARTRDQHSDFDVEYRVVWPDGSVRWLAWRGRSYRDAQGRPVRMEGVAIDVTARKQAEQALRESEAHLTMALTAAQLGSFQLDLASGRLELSPRYRAIFALPPGSNPADRELSQERVHPDDRARVQAARQDVLERGLTVACEFRVLLDDGEVRWIASWSMPRRDVGGAIVGVVGLIQDISARKQDEELRAYENHLLEMVAKGEPLTAVLEELCRSIEQRTWGLRASVLLLSEDGRCLRHGAAPNLPDSFNRALDGLVIGPDAGSCGSAAFHRREVMVDDIDRDPRWAEYRHLAQPHGLRACWSTPIMTTDQCVLGTFAIYADRPRLPTVAERAAIASASHLAYIAIAHTRAERALQDLNQGLERRVAERTALLAVANRELESFSYSVSHDLRSPLRAIDGFSQALLEDYGAMLDGTARGYLDRVRGATARMAELIDDLLMLARVTRLDLVMEAVDLSALARRIADELARAHPQRVLEFTIAPGLVAVCDGRLARIVLENLLGNAVKFTGRRAEARIEFGVRERDGAREFFVADNGAGFDMAYAGKLFGAFQRLHAASDFPGTGIGLATVQRIVQRHHGTVRAEGAPDRGATISFTFG